MKSPFYISSEECDVPLKQKPEVSLCPDDADTLHLYPPVSRWERGLLSRYEEVEDRGFTGRSDRNENAYWGRDQTQGLLSRYEEVEDQEFTERSDRNHRRTGSFEDEEDISGRDDETGAWRRGQLSRDEDEPEERGRRGRGRRGDERRRRRRDRETPGPPAPLPFVPTPSSEHPTPKHSLHTPRGHVPKQSSTEKSPTASTPTPPPQPKPFSFSSDYMRKLRQSSFEDPFIRPSATSFSFSREYLRKNLGRSVSLPSHLHDDTSGWYIFSGVCVCVSLFLPVLCGINAL